MAHETGPRTAREPAFMTPSGGLTMGHWHGGPRSATVRAWEEGPMGIFRKISRVANAPGGLTVVICMAVVGTALLIYLLPSDQRTIVNILEIIQTAAIVVGLFSLALLSRQTRLSGAQAEHAAAVNHRLVYHQFFGDLVTANVREKLCQVAAACGCSEAFRLGTPLDGESVAKIMNDDSHHAVVVSYLDEFEEFCGAIYCGLLDEDYAYRLEGERITRLWAVFAPFIGEARKRCPRAYWEVERLACQWIERRKAEDEAEQEAQRKRAAENGVQAGIPKLK